MSGQTLESPERNNDPPNEPSLYGFVGGLANEISTLIEQQYVLTYRVLDLCIEFERLPGVATDVGFTLTPAEKVRIMQTLDSLNEVSDRCETEQTALRNLCVKVTIFATTLRAMHQPIDAAEPRAQQTVAAMNYLDNIVYKFYDSMETKYPILQTKIDNVRREYLRFFTNVQWQAEFMGTTPTPDMLNYRSPNSQIDLEEIERNQLNSESGFTTVIILITILAIFVFRILHKRGLIVNLFREHEAYVVLDWFYFCLNILGGFIPTFVY